MPWTTVDSHSRLQLPPVPQMLPPVPRPVFPLYNVVMDAMKAILPAMDPVAIAERRARLAEMQFQLSPQMQALRYKQAADLQDKLDIDRFKNQIYRKYPQLLFMKPGANGAGPTLPPAVHQAINHPAVDELPVEQPPGSQSTKIDNNQQIEVAPRQEGPSEVIPAAPPAEPGKTEVPPSKEMQDLQNWNDQNFGPVGPAPEVTVGDPEDVASTWGTAGQDLNLTPNELASEEEQAMAPQIMV